MSFSSVVDVVDKKVCEISHKQSSGAPFPTLRPGQLFSTKFGVVEVIQDNRATPTAAVHSTDINRQLKSYHSSITKRDARISREVASVAVETRVRAILLARAYETAGGVLHQQVVAEAYRRAELPVPQSKRIDPGVLAVERQTLKDPSAPEDSYPDRIVECILRPDRRPRVIGDDENAVLEGVAEEPCESRQPPVKMFLARRLLTTVYSEVGVRYHCPQCWACFVSKTGLKYHVDKGICTRRAVKLQEAQKELLESIDKRAQQVLARRDYHHTIRAKKKTICVPIVNAISMEPEALQEARAALALEPKDFRGADGKFRGPRIDTSEKVDECNPATAPKKKKKKSKKPMSVTVPADVVDDLVDPRDTIAELEEELLKLQSQMMGPMYPGVWEYLGYKKPQNKRKPKKTKAQRGKKRRKRNIENDVEMPSDQPTGDNELQEYPPIVDTRVIAAEIDSGRYPSIKRYDGDHDDRCSICKMESAPVTFSGVSNRVVACDFCRQVAHFSCSSLRFTVNDPGPEDDFICHKCIGVIAARRHRAEKRRLEKVMPGVDEPVAVEEAKMQDQLGLLHGLVPGREFECVAAQGRQVEDLSEMLRDAKSRLSISNEVAAMNRYRLTLVENFANDVKK